MTRKQVTKDDILDALVATVTGFLGKSRQKSRQKFLIHFKEGAAHISTGNAGI
jgi:hypothetical protein